MTPEEFRRDTSDTKKLIEDTIGREIEGYRAAAFSIRPDTRWGLEVLAELGFRYDSSIFPIVGKRYGWPGFPPEIHAMELPGGGSIIEVPPSAIRVLGRDVPACGGGYLRHFPYWFTRWAMRRINRSRPAVVYLHPYEIDTDPPPAQFQEAFATQPVVKRCVYALKKRNCHTVVPKLRRMLGSFKFEPGSEVIGSILGAQWRQQVRRAEK